MSECILLSKVTKIKPTCGLESAYALSLYVRGVKNDAGKSGVIFLLQQNLQLRWAKAPGPENFSLKL